MAYINKEYSNTGRKDIFIKTLIEPGIFKSMNGEPATMSNKVLDNNVRDLIDRDVVFNHNNPYLGRGNVIGKVVDVFFNGEDGAVKPDGSLFTEKGWTAVYQLDEQLLSKYGLDFESAKQLDLSLSFAPEYNTKPTKYNGVIVPKAVENFSINNVALVERGRYNCTQGIMNCSDDDEKNPLDNNKNDNSLNENGMNFDKKDDNKEDKQSSNLGENKGETQSSENKEEQKKDEKIEKSSSENKNNNSENKKDLFGDKKDFCNKQPNQESKPSEITLNPQGIVDTLKAMAEGISALQQAFKGQYQPQQNNFPDSNQQTGIGFHTHDPMTGDTQGNVEPHSHDMNGNASDNVAEHSHEGGNMEIAPANKPETLPSEDKPQTPKQTEDEGCQNNDFGNKPNFEDKQSGGFDKPNDFNKGQVAFNTMEKEQQTLVEEVLPKLVEFLKPQLTTENLQKAISMLTPSQLQSAQILQNNSASEEDVDKGIVIEKAAEPAKILDNKKSFSSFII